MCCLTPQQSMLLSVSSNLHVHMGPATRTFTCVYHFLNQFTMHRPTLHFLQKYSMLCVWNKEALPWQWKESIIVPVSKMGDKTDCSNYWGISRLSTTYRILPNILLSMLTPYADKIIGGHQCEFCHKRSTTDHIFYICQILGKKKWEYNGEVHQLFIDFKMTYDSVSREDMYNILFEFGVPMKLVRLICVCLNEMYNRVQVGIFLAHFQLWMIWTRKCFVATAFQLCFTMCHYGCSSKPGGVDSQVLVYAVLANLIGESMHTIKRNTGSFINC